MWENEIIVLVTSLKKRILADQKKARFSRIAADNAVPPFIKSLFENQVELFLKDEKPVTVQSTPHFNLSDQDLSHLTGRFLDAFRDSAAFSMEEVEEILRTALVLRMDYLVKPIDTMRRLLFNGEKIANQKKIETKLFPFRKVLPYADQLILECQRLNYKEIEADEYGKLITDMLQRIVEPEPVKIAMHDFSMLTEFLSETKGEEVQIVEGPLVQEFFADRSLWGFRRAIEVEMKLGKEDFNRIDLEMTIRRYLELKADFSKNSTASDVVMTEKKIEIENKIEPFDLMSSDSDIMEEPSVEPDVESFNLLDEDAEFEQVQLDDIEDESEDSSEEEIADILNLNESQDEEPEISADATSQEAEQESWDLEDVLGDSEKPEKREVNREAEPVLKEDKPPKKQMRIIRRDQKEDTEDNLDVVKPSSSLGLKNLIDKKTEKVFIKKLFGNDETAYQQLVNKLEESESWRVAKILIDNELFKRDVDPFSREAIKLVDLVYSRYYPEEGVGGA